MQRRVTQYDFVTDDRSTVQRFQPFYVASTASCKQQCAIAICKMKPTHTSARASHHSTSNNNDDEKMVLSIIFIVVYNTYYCCCCFNIVTIPLLIKTKIPSCDDVMLLLLQSNNI